MLTLYNKFENGMQLTFICSYFDASFEPDVVLCFVSIIPLNTEAVLFAVFRQAGPPQRIDCLTPRWETVLKGY